MLHIASVESSAQPKQSLAARTFIPSLLPSGPAKVYLARDHEDYLRVYRALHSIADLPEVSFVPRLSTFNHHQTVTESISLSSREVQHPPLSPLNAYTETLSMAYNLKVCITLPCQLTNAGLHIPEAKHMHSNRACSALYAHVQCAFRCCAICNLTVSAAKWLHNLGSAAVMV